MEDVLNVYIYRAPVGVLTFLFLFVFANISAAVDTKVTLIDVQGNKRIETSTILAKIKTKEVMSFHRLLSVKTSRCCISSGILRTSR
jgi:hypothetical protein